MRLHTDFHDYYDTAVGFGIDDNVHYNRFTKEVEIRVKSNADLPTHSYAGLLGFCGEIYPFTVIRKYDRKFFDYGEEPRKIIESFVAFNYAEYKEKESAWTHYTDSCLSYRDNSRDLKHKQFFIDWNYQSDEIFLEYKVPVWIVRFDRSQRSGILNPKLKDYGFDRIKDYFAAFQEISMYLANILVEQKETAEIEDKFRIEQYGFDLKKSFRKEKVR